MIATLLRLLMSPSAWLAAVFVTLTAVVLSYRASLHNAEAYIATLNAEKATKAAQLARCTDQVTTLTAGLEYATTTLHDIQAESERRRMAADVALKKSREAAVRRRTTIDGQGAEEINTWLREALR